jgi:hypothetical protein
VQKLRGEDTRERRHHYQDRRRQREHLQQRDDLDDALGQPATVGALAEIDADVLRNGRSCEQENQLPRPTPPLREHGGQNGCHDFPGGRPSKLAISSSRLS